MSSMSPTPRGTASGSGATSRSTATIWTAGTPRRISQPGGGGGAATSTIASEPGNRAASSQAAPSGSSSSAAKTETSTGYRAARPRRSAIDDWGPTSALQAGLSRTPSGRSPRRVEAEAADPSVMSVDTNPGAGGQNRGQRDRDGDRRGTSGDRTGGAGAGDARSRERHHRARRLGPHRRSRCGGARL